MAGERYLSLLTGELPRLRDDSDGTVPAGEILSFTLIFRQKSSSMANAETRCGAHRGDGKSLVR